jgi:hypothetical protein
MLTHQL